MRDAPMWRCPSCGRPFANTNQTHSCAPLGEVDRHFAGSAAHVRATFDRILEVVTELGPVTVLPEKTRIALQVRMSFAAVTPRRRWLAGHLVLARRVDGPRFHSVQAFSPRNVLHAFRLRTPAEVDAEFTGWLRFLVRSGTRGLNRALALARMVMLIPSPSPIAAPQLPHVRSHAHPRRQPRSAAPAERPAAAIGGL